MRDTSCKQRLYSQAHTIPVATAVDTYLFSRPLRCFPPVAWSSASLCSEVVPELPYVDIWNFPAALEANTDALRGRQPKYHLQFRAVSRT